MVKFIKSTLWTLLVAWLLIFHARPSFAVKQTFYFVSMNTGYQNTGTHIPGFSGEDTYLQDIELTHGNLRDHREVTPIGLSFNFYAVLGKFGNGMSVEVSRYHKHYSFKDGSSVTLDAQALMYSFSIIYRADWWYPYIGLGTGNFNVKIVEKLKATETSPIATKASFQDAAPYSMFYDVGSRFPLGDWGLLVSWRGFDAKIKVDTTAKRLQLGGLAVLGGIYYGF